MKTIISDVIVCGGGTAGLAAALAAARAGSRVCIVEEDARIGGAMTDQYIQMFCGRPYQGILLELQQRMMAFAPYKRDRTLRHGFCILAYMQMFEGLPVEIYTRQHVDRVAVEAGRLTAVETADYRFEGKVFIDATGDGDVAALAGCPFRYGREAASEFDEAFAPAAADRKVQRCTLMYSVKRLPDAGHREDGSGAAFDDDESLIWGPTVICKDTTSRVALDKAQQEALAMMPEAIAKWREKGYVVSSIAPKIGVRESRRIEGRYMLSYRDIAEQRRFFDSVCVVNYNIDPWDPDGNPMHDDRLKSTAMPDYEIPYRCMINDTVENMIVTGRCVSATHVANSSLRVMGIAIPLGQAAGNAAHLAAQDGGAVGEIDVEALRRMQREGGVRVSVDE